MSENPRVFKPQRPVKLIVGAILAGLIVMAFIVYATWDSSQQIINARMRGTVIEKKFVPFVEQQITIGKGGVENVNKKGNFTITVSVLKKDGSKEDYIVENLDEKKYEAIKIGDEFDVGPYLVP